MAPSTGETYLNLFHYHSRLMFVESTCNEDFGKLLSIKLGGIGNLYSIESTTASMLSFSCWALAGMQSDIIMDANASKRTLFLIMRLI